MEFSKTKYYKEKLGILLAKIYKTWSTVQRHESGILEHVDNEKNVTIVDKLGSLLRQEGQKQTHHSTCQISKETNLTQCSNAQITQCFFLKSVFHLPTWLLPIIVKFSYIYFLQGSVATQIRCGGIFCNHFIANCPGSVWVKKFWKSVNISWRYRNDEVQRFFWDTL